MLHGPYGDSDLLVAPKPYGPAEEILRELGFRPLRVSWPWESQTWVRGFDQAAVDLHCSLVGAAAAPATVWEELTADAETRRRSRRRGARHPGKSAADCRSPGSARGGGPTPRGPRAGAANRRRAGLVRGRRSGAAGGRPGGVRDHAPSRSRGCAACTAPDASGEESARGCATGTIRRPLLEPQRGLRLPAELLAVHPDRPTADRAQERGSLSRSQCGRARAWRPRRVSTRLRYAQLSRRSVVTARDRAAAARRPAPPRRPRRASRRRCRPRSRGDWGSGPW